MTIFKVALLQIHSNPERAMDHLLHGLAACRQARDKGAHLALFPEMWQSGYPPVGYDQPGVEPLQFLSMTRDSTFFHTFQEAARDLSIGIGMTYLEETVAGMRNAISIISPTGEVLLTYAKVHTCSFDWENKLLPGDGFPVVDFPFPAGLVRLGCMICMDREFPEAARLLMLSGAEIILVPNACELEQHRLHQVEARAFENIVGIAVTNYPEPHENGHSIALSPVAFDETGSVDMKIFEAGGEEGIYLVEFDLDQIREYRNCEPWGDKFRHPKLYKKIAM